MTNFCEKNKTEINDHVDGLIKETGILLVDTPYFLLERIVCHYMRIQAGMGQKNFSTPEQNFEWLNEGIHYFRSQGKKISDIDFDDFKKIHEILIGRIGDGC